jgi:hypothetical protein
VTGEAVCDPVSDWERGEQTVSRVKRYLEDQTDSVLDSVRLYGSAVIVEAHRVRPLRLGRRAVRAPLPNTGDSGSAVAVWSVQRVQ